MARPKLKRELYHSPSEERYFDSDDFGDDCVEVTADQVDSHMLAFLLSEDAENDNYHHLVGSYEWIAAMAKEYGNEEVAASMMIDLYNAGGFVQ